ncbi:hypothetical protein GCK72_015116 [Caenorhabditis remanei]|uniref:BolA-like protein n=4 Tax=Caenorhabditis TaxID=6237 RepID=A0A6A5GTX5_CAERE|nr:hypothetical protein GCK72_015116 [Caenorhabditis remanei]KAF1758657.1 hypothetical protein GCK72_015116 [Caenorhabditis remanei]
MKRVMSTLSEGPVARLLREKLSASFQPKHLEVECESHLHNVPKGAEMHFRVQVVSDAFEGKRVIERHRLVNTCLAEELATSVHALRIDAIPTSKWDGQKQEESPTCRGGFGK